MAALCVQIGHGALQGFCENLHGLRAGDSVAAGKFDRGCGTVCLRSPPRCGPPGRAVFISGSAMTSRIIAGLRSQPLGGGHEHFGIVDVPALDQVRSLHGFEVRALALRHLGGEGLDGDRAGCGMGVGEVAARHEFRG